MVTISKTLILAQLPQPELFPGQVHETCQAGSSLQGSAAVYGWLGEYCDNWAVWRLHTHASNRAHLAY